MLAPRHFYAPAYVLGMMAVTIGPTLWMPLPPAPSWLQWGMPAISVAKADRITPAPPIVEVPKHEDRLEPRPVPTETIKRAAVTATPERGLPWSCETIRAAATRLTKDQRERLARVYRLTKEQRAAAERCLRT